MDALAHGHFPSTVSLQFCNHGRGPSATCLTASHSDLPEMANIAQPLLLRCAMHRPSPAARQRTPAIQILSFRIAQIPFHQMPPSPTLIQQLATSEASVRQVRQDHQLLPGTHTTVVIELRPDNLKLNDNHYAHCHKPRMRCSPRTEK